MFPNGLNLLATTLLFVITNSMSGIYKFLIYPKNSVYYETLKCYRRGGGSFLELNKTFIIFSLLGFWSNSIIEFVYGCKCPFIIVYGNNNFLHFLHLVNKVLKKYVFVKDVISNEIPFKDEFTCFQYYSFFLAKMILMIAFL